MNKMTNRFRTSNRRRGAISRALALGLGCLGVIVLATVAVLAVGVGSYNGLVSNHEQVKQSWAQVLNQYKRRSELIPNLVETVKGAKGFEQQTLTAVTEARASVGRVELPSELPTDPAKLRAFTEAQGQLGSALSRLLVVSEQYPTLRASQNFLSLQDQLEGTENRIAVAREDYTRSVRDYNSKRRGFPGNVLAGMFGFEEVAQFEITEAEKSVPKVDFGSK